MKKIGIIGSESFLARNFLKYIKNRIGDQYEIVLYDYIDKSSNSQLKYIQVDFSNKAAIEKIDFNCDILMVFMGATGTVNGFEQYEKFINVNETFLLNILTEYVKQRSNALIIYPSTRLIFKSSENSLINEDSERELKSIYAVTKYAAEQYLKIYHEVYDLKYVILRICTPIGSLLNDNGSYGTFEIFKEQAKNKHKITLYGDGSQRKTFTQIEDVCKAMELIIDNEEPKYNDYNLGGKNLSLLEIADSIAKEHNVPIEFIPWPSVNKKVDGGSVVFDSKRFDQEFGMSYSNIM